MSEIKLLPSQSELIGQIERVVTARPSFVVLNGEEGSGKTFLSHYLAANGVSPEKNYRTVIFRSNPDSTAADVRDCFIKSMFNADIFDKNDDLSETARMFEISQKNFLLIVDAVDYYDQDFLNELYRFYLNYGKLLDLSVVVTTSHLLVDLITPPDGGRPDVFEVTISCLSPGEKISLLKTLIGRKVVSERLRDISFEELADDCGSQPNQIVEFAERFVMNTFSGSAEGVYRSEAESIVPNEDGAQLKMNKAISNPKGPGKAVVICVAVILTIALVGVSSLLLKQMPAPGDQDEVLVTVHTDLNDPARPRPQGTDRDQQTVVNSMIAGEGDSHVTGGEFDDGGDDVFGGNISDEALKPAGDDDDNGSEQTASAGEGPAAPDSTVSAPVQTAEVSPQVTTPSAPKATDKPDTATAASGKEQQAPAPAAQDAAGRTETAGVTKPADKGETTAAAAGKNGSEAPASQATKPQTQTATAAKDNRPAQQQAGKDSTAKPVTAGGRDQNAGKNNGAATAQSTAAPAAQGTTRSTSRNQTQTAAKAGEVRPFVDDKAARQAPGKTAATGNFVVQVACNSKITDLQDRKRKLGDSAFIYERKHALKYVLAVGYYATRQEAQAAARKIGNGAFVKSADAVSKERN